MRHTLTSQYFDVRQWELNVRRWDLVDRHRELTVCHWDLGGRHSWTWMALVNPFTVTLGNPDAMEHR